MLATDVDAGGGVARHSFNLLAALSARGVRTFLLARNYTGKPWGEMVGDTMVRRSPVFRRSRGFNSMIYLLYVGAWLIRNRRRYDVVHCQQMSGPALAAVLAGRITGKPVLVRVTSCGPQGEIAEVAAMAFASFRRTQLRAVRRWVALTHEMKRELIGFGVPPERVTVIANGTVVPSGKAYDPMLRAAARQRLGLTAPRIVVYVGRLSSEKGLDVLLEAWAGMTASWPDTELVLVGGGGAYRNVESALRDKCARLRIRSVVFVGHVPRVTDYLIAADLFVLPSVTEGMSNSLVEAMAAGLCIVASDIPANRELITAGENGVLFPPGNEAALRAALEELLTDDDRARSLGRRARIKAEEELSVEVMSDQYFREYSAIRSDKPPTSSRALQRAG